jgi:hypothetical protein
MPDFPTRRIDDRELRAELALAAEVVGDAPEVRARRAQLFDQFGRHAAESK